MRTRKPNPQLSQNWAFFRLVAAVALGCSSTFVATGCGPAIGPLVKLASISSPSLPETSDPSVLRVDSRFYVYGSNNSRRAPVTQTTDINRKYSLSEKDLLTTEAMPTAAAWVARPSQLWAPTVGKFGARWVMFFSADRRNPPQPNNAQCVGRAWAFSPAGPFVPESQPFTCGLDQARGALDPELTSDAQGNQFLLVAFSDTDSPIHSIPLDGAANPVGAPVQILGRQFGWEYHFIENPAMTYDYTRGNYLLTYSAGVWWQREYSTGIARCSSPVGPCTSDPSGPWIASSAGRTAPGGLCFFSDTNGAGRA
ncbi:MAG: family 43 glycosylhydrolase, partial [Microthrixaceae bacterium]